MRLLTLTLLLVAAPAVAQTAIPPYTTTNRLAFAAPSNASTAVIAQALEYHFTVTAGSAGTPTPIAGVIVPGVACTGTTAPFDCTAPLLAGWLPTLNDLGQKNLTMFGIDVVGGGGSGPVSAPFISRVPPGAPIVRGIQ